MSRLAFHLALEQWGLPECWALTLMKLTLEGNCLTPHMPGSKIQREGGEAFSEKGWDVWEGRSWLVCRLRVWMTVTLPFFVYV